MDHIIGYSIACFSASDIKINTFCVWHRPVVHLTGKFQVIIHINQFRWYNQFVTVWTHQNCMLLRQYNLNTSIVPSSCPTHDWEGKAPLHTHPLLSTPLCWIWPKPASVLNSLYFILRRFRDIITYFPKFIDVTLNINQLHQFQRYDWSSII